MVVNDKEKESLFN
jgi:hypothetical protein